MGSHMSRWVGAYKSQFTQEAVRFGFTAFLQHRFNQDRAIIRRLSVPLLRIALEVQQNIVNAVFGVQSSYETLSWLLQHGADPNARLGDGSQTIFKQFISETGALARRSKIPWAYPQWQKSLTILLHHGASIDDVFADARLLEALPQIGYTDDSSIHNLADAELLKEKRLQQGLHRQLDIYAAFLDHDLDPNRRISSFTLWEMWLWYMCRWQIDHGRLEQICTRAMTLFLSHDADPFHNVWFGSDRSVEIRNWSVSDVVESFFTEESRGVIKPVLEAAKRRWQERYPQANRKRQASGEARVASGVGGIKDRAWASRSWYMDEEVPRKSPRRY